MAIFFPWKSLSIEVRPNSGMRLSFESFKSQKARKSPKNNVFIHKKQLKIGKFNEKYRNFNYRLRYGISPLNLDKNNVNLR